MTIYYEDNDIIVCEKPYGISSQESSGENMISCLKSHTGCNIYCIHRLDIQTTGVMVYAKNKESAAALSSQASSRELKKEYLAVCHGDIDEYGEMVDLLYHDRINNKSFVVSTKRNGSKEAKLEFWKEGEALVDEKQLSLVKIALHTGRTHQIRVQFSHRANPLYGDGKYGAKDNDKIALHSAKISFIHPKTNKPMEFCSVPQGKIWEQFIK